MKRLLRLGPAEPFHGRVATAVVIDVLRMTSTAAVLMRVPSRTEVAVAATIDDLPRLSLSAAECVIVSELAPGSWPGPWVDNSPALVAQGSFGERTPVLVTTNGTRTLLSAAAFADQVLLASFVDLHAVARYLGDHSKSSLALLPAGDFARGEARIEDELCADALAELLAGGDPDIAASHALIRQDARVRHRLQASPGFSADLELALAREPSARVLEFNATNTGAGRIVRADARAKE